MILVFIILIIISVTLASGMVHWMFKDADKLPKENEKKL